jgi:hypothetical protein
MPCFIHPLHAMRTTTLLLTLNLILTLGVYDSFGWGATGHRITGWIADKHLNKKARKEIERILGQQSLAMASTWMDEIRSDTNYDYMEDWHWVTIPDGMTYEQSEKNLKGDIVKTIDRIIKELKSHRLNEAEELQDLKILIHLIGDIHQPLHVGRGNDRGGNDTKVTWFRSDSNLHRVWDSEMIDDTKLSYTEFAESLERPNAAYLKVIQDKGINDWISESMDLRAKIYDTGNSKLGYLYTYNNLHIVRKRLLEAGIRIAHVLNDIYGK